MTVNRCRPGVLASMAMVLIALTGCTATSNASPAPVSTTFRKGVLAAEQDVGDAADLRSVRRAAVAALSDENQAFVVDQKLRGENPAEVLAALTAPDPTQKRAILLGRARTSKLASGLEHSFSFYAHQEFGPDWTGSGSRTAWLDRDVWASSTFHVDRWQGVRVNNSTARALVRGEHRGTSWGGALKRDNWAQYKLTLHRDPTAPNGWRIIHEEAASTAA